MKKQKQNLKVIILLGPPGSGKGTQAILLAEKFNLYYLETSKLLEKVFSNPSGKEFIEVNGQKYYLKEERKLWKTGKLCSPPFVFFLVKKKIKEIFEEKKGIVFAGSPRTLEEAKKMMPFLEELYAKSNIKIFYLDLSMEQSVWRNSHRRICKLMRHPILYTEETAKLTFCPLDGSELMKRTLDKPEIVEKRFKVYQEQTLPLFDYLEKEGFKIQKINGKPPVADVFKDILKSLQ